MADRSAIEWTDATWNPIAGCSRVSEGCRHCYAERLAARGLPGFEGLAHFVDRPAGAREARWTGAVTVREHLMDQPLRWKRPRRIFVNSMSDLFHDAVPDEVIDRIFAVMALAPQHTFQVLTKRPERMRKYLENDRRDVWAEAWAPGTLRYSRHQIQARMSSKATPEQRWAYNAERVAYPLPNVWLGVSVEDQVTADVRLPYLLDTPAAIRFASYEPALGAIDWTNLDNTGSCRTEQRHGINVLWKTSLRARLDLVIMGGESGSNARPMHPDWARQTRDHCAAAGVPFFFKQWGEFETAVDRDRDDPDWRLDYSNTFADQLPTKWLNLAGGCGFHGERFHVMRRIGKARAGRLLDGVEHNGMPEPRHA